MTDEERKEVTDTFISIGERFLEGSKHFHLEPVLTRDTIQAIKELQKENEQLKEKWHDLRKDPNDLPKHSGLYCVQCGEVREYVKEEKSWFTVHFEPCMNRTEETYLWCELPKFEEKINAR